MPVLTSCLQVLLVVAAAVVCEGAAVREKRSLGLLTAGTSSIVSGAVSGLSTGAKLGLGAAIVKPIALGLLGKCEYFTPWCHIIPTSPLQTRCTSG